MKFYSVDCNWNELLKETARVYKLWEGVVKPQIPPHLDYDSTLSKNAYNLITLSTPLPEYYKFWRQVYENLKGELGTPIWIHAWLNVHRKEELGVKSLEWHNHSYADYHGFIHISDKASTTEFKNGTMIPNNQGQMYFGDASLDHRVVSGQFDGIRASIAYDLLIDPRPEHFGQNIFVPIL